MTEESRIPAISQIPAYLKSYGFVIVVWVFLSILLSQPHYSILSGVLQTTFIIAWTYFGHIFAHMISERPPINILNTHVSMHHDSSGRWPRWLNLLVEAISNSLGFIILLIVQWISGIELLSTSVVLFSALLYVFIHILDYSILGNSEHRLHHIKTFCNYAPDFMDAAFGTRCEPDAPFYDQNIEVLHAVVAFLIVSIFKRNYELK
jgi:hypothetical protein